MPELLTPEQQKAAEQTSETLQVILTLGIALAFLLFVFLLILFYFLGKQSKTERQDATIQAYDQNMHEIRDKVVDRLKPFNKEPRRSEETLEEINTHVKSINNTVTGIYLLVLLTPVLVWALLQSFGCSVTIPVRKITACKPAVQTTATV